MKESNNNKMVNKALNYLNDKEQDSVLNDKYKKPILEKRDTIKQRVSNIYFDNENINEKKYKKPIDTINTDLIFKNLMEYYG
jgi:hypothetical protein